jgi:HPt (histidine-containing phosphotransfer) domain-containing protein
LSIINDILDFSKIEAVKLDIESLEMDVPGNAEEVGSVIGLPGGSQESRVDCQCTAGCAAARPRRSAATERIRSLESNSGSGVRTPIVLDNSRESFVLVRACVERADRRQLARLVHQLAGASANIHAAALRDLCLALEAAAPSAAGDEIEDSVTKIGAELARVSAALRQDADRISRAAQPAF